MQLLLLVPFLLSFWFLWRGSLRSAFMNVYLPMLLLVPMSFTWRFPHIPPLNLLEMTVLPLVIALPFYAKLWQPRRIDLWVFGFMVSLGIAEAHQSNPATGLLVFIGLMFDVLFPYLCGRLLIEQWMRRDAVLKRIVTLIAIAGVLSVTEFFTKVNWFRMVCYNLFPQANVSWVTQTRYGFGRISGPYGHAILAGIMFGTAAVLLFYIRRTDRRWLRRKVFNGFPLKLRTVLWLAILVSMLCTISRGPWLGAGVSLVIATLGLRRKLDKKTVLVLLVLAAAGLGLRSYLDKVAGPGTQYVVTADDPNQTAQYRTQLWPVYEPIVAMGGWRGFGVSNFPKAGGYTSIDNEYLFILVTQGYLGLTFFILMLLETLLTLYRSLSRMRMYEDRLFTFTLGGLLIGLAFTMATVYLDEQAKPLLYLLMGWIQALRPANSPSPAAVEMTRPAFSFRRVWT